MTRYALYYAPAAGSAHAEFGAQWLGRDALAAGRMVAPVEMGGIAAAARWSQCRTARRYGLHATLKPPFRLAASASPVALEEAVAELALAHAAFELPVQLARLGEFLAWRPVREDARLAALAADCVSRLDGFRQPPDAAELARRRQAGLTPGQEALLQRWGYPYVMEQFRFHLTLSDALPPDDPAALYAGLQRASAALQAVPLRIDALSLFVEAAPGDDFQCLRRFPLLG
jgi:putative phosphonate metabolism protein